MVKTRVHDLAAEFGVAPEQLLSMLKDMNIFVRSHLSALESDQVSAIRVRWEREKRKSAEEPTAKKGRRKAVKAEPAQAPVDPADGRIAPDCTSGAITPAYGSCSARSGGNEPPRRIASVLGGVSHLRHTEFGGRRPYRFLDERSSASGRWEMWMDAAQARAVRDD